MRRPSERRAGGRRNSLAGRIYALSVGLLHPGVYVLLAFVRAYM